MHFEPHPPLTQPPSGSAATPLVFSNTSNLPFPLPRPKVFPQMSSKASPSPARISRALGAILGVHAGDSLGATLEFMDYRSIKQRYPQGLRDIIGGGPFDWPVGHATDDTDLTRAVLLGYWDVMRNRNSDGDGRKEANVVKLAAEWSLKWFEGDWPGRKKGEGPIDIGRATMLGLLNYQRTRDPRGCGAGQGSAGNGSLMRCIPTALFAGGREERMRESMGISAITHDDTRCTVACAAYNEIVAALMEGEKVQVAVDIGVKTARELGVRSVEEAIERGKSISILETARDGPGEDLPGITSGYVLQSLTVAVAAVLDPRPLEDVLVDVVRIGGDTDTNGAISGGLLGARDGVEKIPQRWLEKLQFREEFENLAKVML